MTGNTNPFPGFNKLYYIQQLGLGRKCFYADLDEQVPTFELLRGEWKPIAPLEAIWSMGRAKPEEIARGRTVAWFYLSPRVQKLFHDCGLTGWSTYPISLHDKFGELCSGYAGLCIKGRCGPLQKERGSLVSVQTEESEFSETMGMYFDESTWDGSDFFCPAGVNAYMLATDKVKGLFEEHKIGGFEFVPLAQATWYP